MVDGALGKASGWSPGAWVGGPRRVGAVFHTMNCPSVGHSITLLCNQHLLGPDAKQGDGATKRKPLSCHGTQSSPLRGLRSAGRSCQEKLLSRTQGSKASVFQAEKVMSTVRLPT